MTKKRRGGKAHEHSPDHRNGIEQNGEELPTKVIGPVKSVVNLTFF